MAVVVISGFGTTHNRLRLQPARWRTWLQCSRYNRPGQPTRKQLSRHNHRLISRDLAGLLAIAGLA